MQLLGRGTIGTKLQPHVHDQNAIDDFMKEEAATHHNPANDPNPGVRIIGRRYAHSFGREG